MSDGRVHIRECCSVGPACSAGPYARMGSCQRTSARTSCASGVRRRRRCVPRPRNGRTTELRRARTSSGYVWRRLRRAAPTRAWPGRASAPGCASPARAERCGRFTLGSRHEHMSFKMILLIYLAYKEATDVDAQGNVGLLKCTSAFEILLMKEWGMQRILQRQLVWKACNLLNAALFRQAVCRQ